MSIRVSPKDLIEVGDLDGLNSLLDPLSFRAGWNKHEPSLWPHPKTTFVPAHWSWAQAKAGLDSAGRLINTEQAERRNLFMVNPIEGNYYSTLRTIVSAYQMIMPGERARSHRHTPNALRLVIDVPDNTYTVVDGVRIDMRPGDVVLTPNWSWHGHASEGDRPGYWIDFLDVPLVQLLETMFLEYWPEGFQKPERSTRNSEFVFPWEVTDAKLRKAVADERGRLRVELGSPALPTLALHMERLTSGLKMTAARSTANQVVAVVAGEGQTTVEGKTITWKKGDVMAMPIWHEFRHEAEKEAVLFSVSDEPAQERLGFLRIEPARPS
jgi:gentisate 1,2-dioxygenase